MLSSSLQNHQEVTPPVNPLDGSCLAIVVTVRGLSTLQVPTEGQFGVTVIPAHGCLPFQEPHKRLPALVHRHVFKTLPPLKEQTDGAVTYEERYCNNVGKSGNWAERNPTLHRMVR